MVLAVMKWMEEKRHKYFDHGPHQSTMAHVPFLREYFSSMVGKGQWVVLPHLVAKDLLGLRLIPPRVKEERHQRPRWFGDYSDFNSNEETLPIAAQYAMLYGRALDRLIRDTVIVDPALVPIYVLEVDISNAFYHIGLRPTDTPKLILFFSLIHNWREDSSNTDHPSHGMEELYPYILHGYGNSSVPGQQRPALQPSVQQAQTGRPCGIGSYNGVSSPTGTHVRVDTQYLSHSNQRESHCLRGRQYQRIFGAIPGACQ